jgi:Barstar (barnase inhibitor)
MAYSALCAAPVRGSWDGQPRGGKVQSVPVVEIPMSHINDGDTFHDTFAQALGFPDFYGRNMDAWIDCLTYADEDDGMRAITAGPGEVLTLELRDCREFRSRCSEIYQVLIDCAAFVNWRRSERGARSILALSFR